MIDLGIVALCLGVALVASESALGGRKLQTGLSRVLVLWGAIGAALVLHFAFARGAGMLVFGVFWSGAFLTWFGVRSHVESSILLRLVFLLRGGGQQPEALLARYEALYGPEQRLEELLRSGLAEREGEGLRVTPKGRRILAAVDWLR